MKDLPFVIFIAFGCLWVLMGGAAWIALLKADGQPIRFGKWGLVVAIPIVLPLLVVLALAAIYH